jgi:HTH-type transcriptional regulator, quorum sensing regulator NprR
MPSSTAAGTPNTLGDRIREARQASGMTQSELAGTDYSVSYVSAVERGKIRPSLRALAWLASKLNVNLSDLLAMDVPFTVETAGGVPLAEDSTQNAIAQAQIDLAEQRYAAARDGLESVRDSVRLPSQKIQINLLLGEAYIRLGDGERARAVLENNLKLTRDIDPVTQEQSRNLLGEAYNLLGMQMLAFEAHRQCLEAIDSHIVRDPSFELSVLQNLGNEYSRLGQTDKAVETFERASALGRHLLTPQGIADLYLQVSLGFRRDGLIPQAQRYADMAAEHLRAAANRHLYAQVQSSLGLAYANTEDTGKAEATLKEAKDLAERNEDDESVSMALASLSQVQLANGDNKAALASAKKAQEHAAKIGNAQVQGRALLALAEAMLANGDSDGADKNFAKGLELLSKSGSQAELSRAYAHYAALLRQRGDYQRAFEYLEKSQQPIR